jgi:hypothetical protein
MSTENEALNFVVGMSTKGIPAAVDELTRGFGKVGSAAEFAHRAISGTPPSAPPSAPSTHTTRFRQVATDTVTASQSVSKAMHAMGVAASVFGWGVVTSAGYATINMYIEHTKEMIRFRRGVGLSATELRDFSSQLIMSSSKYGAALGTANSIAFALSSGLVRTTKDAAELGAQLGQLEHRTGITAETSVDLVDTLSTYGKVMSAEGVAHFSLALGELTSDVRGNANALAHLVGGNKDLVATWKEVPGRAENMVKFLTVLGASYQEVGGKAGDLDSIVQGLSTSDSELSKQFRAHSGDAKSMMGWLTATSDKMRSDTGLKQEFMKTFGITEVSVINKINESVSKWSENEKRFEGYLGQTDEALRTRAAGRMTDIEKLAENFRVAKAEALGLLSTIDRTLNVTGWLAKAVKEVGDSLRVAKLAVTPDKFVNNMVETMKNVQFPDSLQAMMGEMEASAAEAKAQGLDPAMQWAAAHPSKDDIYQVGPPDNRQMNAILEAKAVESGGGAYRQFRGDGDAAKDKATSQKATEEYSKQMAAALAETVKLLTKMANSAPGFGGRGPTSAETGTDIKGANAAYSGRK